jgi:hypothetical protein
MSDCNCHTRPLVSIKGNQVFDIPCEHGKFAGTYAGEPIYTQAPLGLAPERIWLEKRCLDLAFAVQRTLDGLKHRPDYGRLRDLAEELTRHSCELVAMEEAEEAAE